MSGLEGRTLGHFLVVERIGTGGMGEVYRAHDERLDRDVAIKVLPEAVAQDPARLERFRREARAVARLEHPNILAIHDFGTESGITYAVTELLEGQTLRERVSTSGLPWQKAVELGAAMADGLAAAHAKGIVHRDLKPENVFVTSEGRIKILDFGLATLHEEVSPEAATGTLTPGGTQPGTVLGTLGYMAPEQLKGEAADARSDIFALGCVLYEMASGRRAFAGDTSAELIAAILKEEPRQLSSTGAAVPADLESTIHRCLEKDPAARFQSAADLAFALRSLATGPAVAMAVPTDRARRRRPLIAAAAVIAAAVGAAGIYLGTRETETAPGIGASGRPAVAVWQFEVHTGSEDTAWLATGLPSMLVTGLAQTRGLDVISTERLREVLKNLDSEDADGADSDAVPRAALRAGAGAVVTGSIYSSGPEVRIDVQVQDVHSGRLLAAHTAHGDDVFPIAEELIGDIRTSLDLSDTPTRRAITEITTSSEEAYRLYWEGHVAHKELRWQRTADLLARAVEIDPSFALAHFELWILHSGYGIMPNAISEEHRRCTLDNLDRLTERQQLLVQAFNARFDGDLVHAAELLEQVIRDYPDEEWAYELLANINGWGLFREDEVLRTYRRGVEAIPRSSFMHTGCAYALLNKGRYEDALDSFETVVDLRPREPNSYDSLGDYYLVTGRPDVGLQKYTRALEVDPDHLVSHTGRAWALAMLGRYDEALAEAARYAGEQSSFLKAFLLSRVGRYGESSETASEGIRLADESQDLSLQVDFALLDAIVAVEQGAIAPLSDLAARSMEMSRSLRDPASRDTFERASHIFAGFAHVGAKDLERARHEIETVRTLLERPHWAPDDWWLAALEGETALANGELDAAEAAFRRGRPVPKAPFVRVLFGSVVYCNHPPGRDLLARVALARGDLDRAIRIYRELNAPSIDSQWTSGFEPRYVLEIARLLDRKGDLVAAGHEYARFLELWKDADEGLPELEEARGRLTALAGPEL